MKSKININLLGYVVIALILAFIYGVLAYALHLPYWPATVLMGIMIVITLIRLIFYGKPRK